ncbi:P-GlycoProtein related [Aphelenchoides bicaudatus]|nr:P-GlycoProtein related [Aphelenchoides bicaudatus]
MGKKEKSEFKPASFIEMMRYANRFDWALLIAGLFFTFIHGCLPSINMIIFRGITEVLVTGQASFNNGTLDINDFSKNMVIYIVAYFLHGIVTFSIGYCSTACFFTLCERQVFMIRKHFLNTVLAQDQQWFEKNNVGKLTQKMTAGIDQIRNGTNDKIAALLQAIVSLFAGLSVAFWLSWQATLIMVLVNPFLMTIVIYSAKTSKKELRKENEAYGEAGSVADEVINGIRTVAACNAQKAEINRYSSLLEIGCNHGIRRAFFVALFSGLHLLLLFSLMGLIFWYGTKLTLEGQLSPGNVFAVFWASLGGAMRLAIDSSSESGETPKQVKGRIEFSNLHFSYPSRDAKVLDGVSFTVEQGQSIGFVGHTGCGKSTLFTLLLRYYNYTNGEISFDGIPIEKLNVKWLRSQIGVVSQDPVIFCGTVEENLRMGNEKATMDDSSENGYETKIGDGGIKLSGGQKQRLAIARALISNPKLLLLDEATSALDTASERIVQAAIERASSGRTTMIIAHRLSTIKNVDKILVFEAGKLVEQGNHQELMELNGLYKQMVIAQEIEQIGIDDNEETEAGSPKGLRRRSTVSRASSKKKGYERLDEKLEKVEEPEKSSATLLDIFRAAKPEHKYIYFGLLATVIRGVIWPVFSLIYGQLFISLTDAVSHRATDNFSRQSMFIGIAFALLGVVACVCTFFSGFLFAKTGEHLTKRLRVNVFSNILSQDGYYFDSPRHSVGKLTARLASDAPNVQVAIDQRLADVLQGLVSLTTGLAIGFYFDWHMTPIAMLTAFTVVGSQLILTAYMKRRGFKDAEIGQEAAQIASESIEHVKTIQALTREDLMFERYCRASEVPQKRAIQRGLMQAVSFGVTSCYFSIHFSLAYLFALLFIRAGYISPFVAFQTIEAVTMASFTVMGAANYIPEYLRARIAAGLMFGMMNEKPKICSNNGKEPELDGNSFLNNNDLRELNIQHVRSKIALVNQEPTIFNLSIKQNIAYGLENDDVTETQLVEAAQMANLHEFVDSLPEKYETNVGPKGTQLSGGQKARVSLARALIRNPKILLLDEATAALDSKTERQVQAALDKASEGKTSIVIAHRLSTIQNADLIVVMDEGRVVESGTHQQLLATQGLYYSLVQKQSA